MVRKEAKKRCSVNGDLDEHSGKNLCVKAIESRTKEPTWSVKLKFAQLAKSARISFAWILTNLSFHCYF